VNAHTAPAVVLVADDEPTMLELVTRHLRTIAQPKLEVIEASDGDEAWRLARERLPDLVVLDVMMPGMSGWEVCRKIRQDASLAHTGVLMLTGIGESLNETTSPLFGADEHIDKPFDFEELDAKVKQALAVRATLRGSVARPPTNGIGGPAKVARPAAAAPKAQARPKKVAKKAAPKKVAKKAAPKKKVVTKAVVVKRGAAKRAKKAVLPKKKAARAPARAASPLKAKKRPKRSATKKRR